MTNGARGVALAICILTGAACKGTPDDLPAVEASPMAVAREQRLEAALKTHDDTTPRDAPIAQWTLPHALQEISGLALTSDGRLLAHDDELGQVWEIDYRRGILVKHFSLGKEALKGDFEGITVAHDVLFMLASDAKLYKFREAKDGARVEYTVHDTGLHKECEFEGIAFDPAIDALLMACKHVLSKEHRDAVVIFRWSLGPDSTARLAPLIVPFDAVVAKNGGKGFHPSDISVDPLTGNYVLVASEEQSLIEITPAGAIVLARPLGPTHFQVEGVAITKDSILIVSDEARQHPAMITLYRWP